ncbi:MAG: SLBB domain-containing protein [Deltaproteobacteria bacterium]|nr:SLBB domain-containing protein [Deltaproteobacteria bacterium]
MVIWAVIFCFTALADAQDYVVGEGDVLKIVVYENEDLTTTVRISGEEIILVPLIGRVDVKGLSISQIDEKIKNRLADGYLVDPHVSIFIEEFRSKNVTVLGQINKPGLYELQEETTLLELLSKAGGVKDDAGSHAIIKRKHQPDGNPAKIIRVDLKRLLEEGDTTLNVTVMDQDSIYITKADLFYINGQVKKPAAYKWDPDTTLLKAVTMAGGFTDIASRRRIKIIRKINGKEAVLSKARVDESILPDDIIVVPESFF